MLQDFAALLRIRQWVKNCFVFAGIFFSGRYLQAADLQAAILAFFSFCFAASTVYIGNDLHDVERDRLHPRNRLRPIASGRVSPGTARSILTATMLVSLIPAAVAGRPLLLVVGGYLLLNLLYTLALKQVVILDVFCIALGFVLRVVAGTTAIGIDASPWLLLCTLLLSLFLGFAKRRHEIILMGDGKDSTRSVLSQYSPYFLDQMLSVITPSVFLCYILYTVDNTTVAKYGGEQLIYTAPFVLLGIFRYQFLVYERNEGNPSEIIYRDLTLITCIIGWLASFVALTRI